METLTDEMLVKTYCYAKQRALSPDFIQLLKDEIDHRNLQDKVRCFQNAD